MKKRSIALLLIVIIMFIFTSCDGNSLLERTTIDEFENEKNFFSVNDELVSGSAIENKPISNFIEKYNQKQTQEDLKVADDYSIYYNSEKETYYVKSSKANLTIKISSDNSITAALTDESNIDKQLAASSVIIDILWESNKSYELKDDVLRTKQQVEQMQSVINNKIDEFEKKDKEWDTDLHTE